MLSFGQCWTEPTCRCRFGTNCSFELKTIDNLKLKIVKEPWPGDQFLSLKIWNWHLGNSREHHEPFVRQ